MRKIIHNIRQQPEEIRRHILHVITAACGILLVSLWIYSLGTNFAEEDTQARVKNDLKPFSALKANMLGGYNSLVTPDPEIE